METFAERIARLRHQKGLTQKQVALSLEVPVSTYKEWEYGRRIQGEAIYLKLAKILDVNVKTLLSGEPADDKAELIKKVQLASKCIDEIKIALNSMF